MVRTTLARRVIGIEYTQRDCCGSVREVTVRADVVGRCGRELHIATATGDQAFLLADDTYSALSIEPGQEIGIWRDNDRFVTSLNWLRWPECVRCADPRRYIVTIVRASI